VTQLTFEERIGAVVGVIGLKITLGPFNPLYFDKKVGFPNYSVVAITHTSF